MEDEIARDSEPDPSAEAEAPQMILADKPSEEYRSNVVLGAASRKTKPGPGTRPDSQWVKSLSRGDRMRVMRDWNDRWRGKTKRKPKPIIQPVITQIPPSDPPPPPAEPEPELFLPTTVSEVRQAYRGRATEFEEHVQAMSLRRPADPAQVPEVERSTSDVDVERSGGSGTETGGAHTASADVEGVGGSDAGASSSAGGATHTSPHTRTAVLGGAADESTTTPAHRDGFGDQLPACEEIDGLCFSTLCCDEAYKDELLGRVREACLSGRSARVRASPAQSEAEQRMALTKVYFLSMPFIQDHGFNMLQDDEVEPTAASGNEPVPGANAHYIVLEPKNKNPTSSNHQQEYLTF